MRIAAIILAHHKPELVARLLRRLDTPLWKPYVHIDAKADATTFPSVPAAQAIQKRVHITWGGAGIAQASLALLDRAAADPANTHFFLLSGQCFPLKSDDYIRDHISRTNGNYFDFVEMPHPGKSISRLQRWHFYDTKPRFLRAALRRIARRLPNRDVNKLLRGMKPYGGKTWWLLSRDAVEKLLRFLHDNPWYLKAFRYSQHADEMFFQTALLSLGITPDCDSPTATKWVEGSWHPEIIDETILKELSAGWHFAARKFA